MISGPDLQVGFTQCQQNAYETLLESWALYKKNFWRHCIFFSLLTIEEVGKGYYLFEAYNDSRSLTKRDLSNENVFFKHLIKMQIARKNFEMKLQTEISERYPRIPVKGVLGYAESDFDALWKLRNDILFVGYDFCLNKWKHPQQITYDEMTAYDVVEKAQALFRTFEEILHKYGHDTFIIFK